MRDSVGRSARVLSAGALLTGVLPLAAVVLTGWLRSPEAAVRLTRDLAAVAGVSSLTGALSSLGAFLWFASGAILLFVAIGAGHRTSRGTRAFLLAGSALSFYLWLDDFFMVHESLAPRLLGLDERVVYGVLVAGTAAYLTLFRRRILATEFWWLWAALGLLALSMLFDIVDGTTRPLLGGWAFLMEDGCKWLGIVCWARYHIAVAAHSAWLQPAA